MKVTWKYAVQKQTNVPFRWAEKLSRAHSSTCPKKNKRQHTWAKCETCEWQQGTGDKGKLWKEWGWKLGTYILHTHTNRQGIPEGCAKHTYNTRPFENGSAGRREEGLASLTPCTKNEKDEVKRPFLIPERSVQNERGVQNYTHNTKPFWYGGKGTYIVLRQEFWKCQML